MATASRSSRRSSRQREVERNDKAWRAVHELGSMLPMLTSFARMITGNRSVTVKIGKQGAATDGHTIFIAPPISLGKERVHTRHLCDIRGEDKRKLCGACDAREVILWYLYHEVAHIAADSMAIPESFVKDAVHKLIDEWHPAEACSHSPNMKRVATQGKSTLDTVAGHNEFLPLILNALEDARVNALMFKARPGLRSMFDAGVSRTFNLGIPVGEGYTQWRDAKLNAQVIIGLFLLASSYPIEEDYFTADAYRYLADEKLVDMCGGVVNLPSSQQVAVLALDVWRRLQEMGLCYVPKCEVPPPPPPPMPGLPSEGSEDDSGNGSDDDQSDDSAGPADDDDDPGGDGHQQDAGEEGNASVGDEAEPPAGSGDEDEGESDDPSAESSELSDGDDGEVPESGADGDDDHDEGDRDSDGGEGDDQESDAGEQEDSIGPAREGGSEFVSEESGTGEESGDDGDSQDEADSQALGEEDPQSVDEPESDGDNAGTGVGDDSGGRDSDSSDAESSGEGMAGGLAGDGEDVDVSAGGDRLDEEAGEDESGHESGDDSGVENDLAESDDPVGESVWDEDNPELGSYDASEVCIPDAGTPADIDDALKAFGGHMQDDDDPLAVDPHFHDHGEHDHIVSDEDTEAVGRAMLQSSVFDRSSRNLGGLEIIEFPHAGFRPGYHWAPRTGWTPEAFTPSEQVIGKNLLRARLVFSENKRGHDTRHLKSGRVDASVLGRRAPVQDERLFKRRTRPGKRDYVVCIGVDCSGSTAGYSRNERIKRAVFAQAELLSRLGIKFMVWGHTGGFDKWNVYAYPDQENNEYESVWMLKVKGADEPWNQTTKERLASLPPVAENYDGHTLEFYRKQLQTRQETDKVILYYTDGSMPAANYEEELPLLQTEIIECRKRGISLMAVGINTESPTDYGFDTVRVDDDRDLDKVIEQLGRRLLEK